MNSYENTLKKLEKEIKNEDKHLYKGIKILITLLHGCADNYDLMQSLTDDFISSLESQRNNIHTYYLLKQKNEIIKQNNN